MVCTERSLHDSQGSEAALGEGGSAQGWEQEMLPGPAQQEELSGPCLPRTALPKCLPAERPEGELKWLKWRGVGTGAWPGGRGTKSEHRECQCKAPAQEAPSHCPSGSTLPLLACTRCAEGEPRSAPTGKVAPNRECSHASSSSWGALLCCPGPSAHPGHAALHNPWS